MKIKRFNESYRGDKIIKLYNKSIIYKYTSEYDLTQARLETQKKEILNLIDEYVEMNKEYFSKKYNYYGETTKFGFYVDFKKPELSLFGKYNSTGSLQNQCWLKYDDIEGLLKFLEDPNLYRNANKYNL